MGITAKKIWTQYITNDTFTITSDYYFVDVSFVLLSGAGTFQGTAQSNGLPSQPINLVVGQAINVGSGSTLPIEGLILSTTGTIQIVAR